MITLDEVPISPGCRARLAGWQAEVNKLRSYKERGAEAALKFGSRNNRKNKTFQEIRAALERMCCGARRCCYCEDSAADEVEHIAPKALFPERVFDWTNYLYACGPCNGPKNNRYSYVTPSGEMKEFIRTRAGRLMAPPKGIDALIDPRRENPLDFMQLDLAGTFCFVPIAADPVLRRRAVWTIELLDLNKPTLTRARASACFNFENALRSYAEQKLRNVTVSELEKTKLMILAQPHPTVFLEMQRSRLADPLFVDIPEARAWRFMPA
ncbi:hypothetical protein [Bradyrhizobium sp. CCGUVB14]|uniref:hypothetical protein n=1 Tax=Bradyrhizobium sp. CCGUVB14 TaxID=2949628 RepID=UPI0020B45231|nr:hypothetical protein [Bradyrhizobium sp. CCGUVB14]MCP3447203.1 hypothetical protein [Bradyrhizobium sp. CCGUVB14]